MRVHLIATGRVQGVWFRNSTRARAQELGLQGFVRNLADGSVEIVAQGPRADLEALVAWARRGPERATVERLDVQWFETEERLQGFVVVR